MRDIPILQDSTDIILFDAEIKIVCEHKFIFFF